MKIPALPRNFGRLIRARAAALLRAQATNARQGMAALLVSSAGDLAAGVALGFMTGTLHRLPGLIVLVPAAIGMRGNIFGALGSRLGTAIHTGEFDGHLEKRNVAGQNVLASAALTLYVSMALAVLAKETARLFHVTTIPMIDYLTISVVGAVMASVVILGITLGVAALSVKRGWDMDNVAAPVVTAAGDVVTLPSLWLATFLLPVPLFSEAVAVVSAVCAAALTVYILRHRELRLFRKIVRQSLVILLLAGLVDVVAGLTIERRLEQFLAFPGLLVLIPPFLEDAGALGGILSARLASKLHLGSIAPRAVPGRRSWEDIALIYMLAIPVFFFSGSKRRGGLSSSRAGDPRPGIHGGFNYAGRRHSDDGSGFLRLLHRRPQLPLRPRPGQLRNTGRHQLHGFGGRFGFNRLNGYPRSRPMNDSQPRTLKAMLAEAKDTSELMLDLAHAGLYYSDRDLSAEVLELEDDLTRLVHRMREVCLLASRSPSDAAGLASLLQLIASIEVIGNQAVDIAKIVLDSLGIPAELRADLTQAEEIVDRIEIGEGSELQGRTVDELEQAVEELRLLAIRRGPRWIFDPEDTGVLSPGDILVVRGAIQGLPEIRRLAGMGAKPAVEAEHASFWELDRAVDTLVEMKDLAEVSVGLAYAAVLFKDRALAAEVVRLEDRLDDMREALESWVLDAATDARSRPALRGLLHLAVASETIGDAAQAMVWLIERDEELHPVIAEALGEAEDVVEELTVGAGSAADGSALDQLDLRGMSLLALSRGGRWQYRPRPRTLLRAGDDLIFIGPSDAVEDLRSLLTGDRVGSAQ